MIRPAFVVAGSNSRLMVTWMVCASSMPVLAPDTGVTLIDSLSGSTVNCSVLPAWPAFHTWNDQSLSVVSKS